MKSRWEVKGHWPLGAAEQRYASVIIEGEDSYSGQHFAVVVQYDLNERGIVLKGVSVLPPDHHLRQLARHEPADALTVSLLRMLPLDPIRASILESLAADSSLLTPVSLWGRLVEEGGGTATDQERAHFGAARRSVEAAVADAADPFRGARPERGRGAVNDDWYARIAMSYLHYHAQFGQKCVSAMAERLGETPQRVSEWVRRARKLGWLTEAPAPGQAGGRAGLRLMKWLEEQEEKT
jgi:hypothetical protein